MVSFTYLRLLIFLPAVNQNDVQLESCELSFIWGQNEDCRSGDSSERLLQSGNGGKSVHKVLVKREFNGMKHSFYKRFLLVMRI